MLTDAPKVDVLCAQLRTLVSAYQLKPGTQLSISRLSDSFRVSPTPVREALARLHGEGLVTWAPNHGYFISDLTASEMVFFAHLLCRLTKSSLRGLSEAPPAHLLRASAATRVEIDSQPHCEGALSPELYVTRMDCIFHAVLSATRNEQLIRIFETIRHRTRFVRTVEFGDPHLGPQLASLTDEMIFAVHDANLPRAVGSLRQLTTTRVKRMDKTIELAIVKAYLQPPPE